MSLRDSSGSGRTWTKRHALWAGSAAVVLAAGAAAALTSAPAAHVAAQHDSGGAKSAHLASSTCGGPAGAAYVALPGYQAFLAIDTANCDITQTYNEGDPQVPGDSGDYNYAGTDDAVAIHGDTLYFAVTGRTRLRSSTRPRSTRRITARPRPTSTSVSTPVASRSRPMARSCGWPTPVRRPVRRRRRRSA